ncbi:hypothetical protein B0T13DRAFT_516742, partial [Neurospora crassa]
RLPLPPRHSKSSSPAYPRPAPHGPSISIAAKTPKTTSTMTAFRISATTSLNLGSPKNVNVHGQPIQTVRLDDILPFPMGTDNFPMGTDNEIPGVFAACAQRCMKKAVEQNTDCEDPLDIECTCRPEVRAVIEAASDECCREACDDGTPEV